MTPANEVPAVSPPPWKRIKLPRGVALSQPWWRIKPTRVGGTSERLDKRNARRARYQGPPGFARLGPEPKPDAAKILRRLWPMSMKRLIRFLKKSARRAATAKYLHEKTTGPFSDLHLSEHLRHLALFRAAQRIIEHRTQPKPTTCITSNVPAATS